MESSRALFSGANGKIALFFACQMPRPMTLQLRFYLCIEDKYCFIDQTETIYDQNPSFTKSLSLDFIFGVNQKLKFELVNVTTNQVYGTAETTLHAIVNTKSKTLQLEVNNPRQESSKVIIKAEKSQEDYSVVEMTVNAKQLKKTSFLEKSQFYFQISRTVGDSGYVVVYTSEVREKDSNPVWNTFRMTISKLCNTDYKTPIKVQVFCKTRLKDTLIGEGHTTPEQIIHREQRDVILLKPQKNNEANANKIKETGVFRFDKVVVQERYGFLEYIRGGIQINVVLGIDFTSSNGDPLLRESLHATEVDGTLNQYQKAIQAVCNILMHYDSDKNISVFGFGAKVKLPGQNKSEVNHCFPLTGKEDFPSVYELDGVMEAYSKTIPKIEFAGPTLFAPTFEYAIKLAEKNKLNGSQEYTILLIITDGVIDDMEATINCIIASAHLPLSVIIIGVGDANFKDMEILDGDEGLKNSKGVKAERDLVQFVPFKDFHASQELLAAKVLEEIPMQFVEYYSSQGIKPKKSDHIIASEDLKFALDQSNQQQNFGHQG